MCLFHVYICLWMLNVTDVIVGIISYTEYLFLLCVLTSKYMSLSLIYSGLANSYFPTGISESEVRVLAEFWVFHLEIRLPTSVERYFLLGNSEPIGMQHLLTASAVIERQKGRVPMTHCWSTSISQIWHHACADLLCPVFSRSYCYTVWSAIGIFLLSVHLSVTLCILALTVGVHG